MSEEPRSFRLRALLFLYSNANIAGLATALVGPALLFAGFIHSGWLWLTLGLYGCGWTVAQLFSPSILLTGPISDSLSLVETEQRLDELLQVAKPHLEPAMLASLEHTIASIRAILPRLKAAGADDDAYTVRETALRYLPETLASYMALPAVFRATYPIPGSDGKTAKQVLTEQLKLMENKMAEIVVNVSNADAQSLIANGNFLKDKFQHNDFLVSHS